MTDNMNPPAAELRHRLVVDSARRELWRIDSERNVVAASAELTPTQIAREVGTTSHGVELTLWARSDRPDLFVEKEMITRLITESVLNPDLRPAVIQQLHEMKLSMGYMPDPQGDAYVSESGQAVEVARRKGWLTEAEFDGIFRQ